MMGGMTKRLVLADRRQVSDGEKKAQITITNLFHLQQLIASSDKFLHNLSVYIQGFKNSKLKIQMSNLWHIKVIKFCYC